MHNIYVEKYYNILIRVRIFYLFSCIHSFQNKDCRINFYVSKWNAVKFNSLILACYMSAKHCALWARSLRVPPLSTPQCVTGVNCSLYVLPSLYTTVCDGSQLFIVCSPSLYTTVCDVSQLLIACSSLSLHQNDCREPTGHCMFFPLSTPECVTGANCSLYVLPSLYTRVCDGSQLFIACSSLSLHQNDCREPTVHCMFFPLSTPECVTGANCSLHVLPSLFTRMIAGSQLFIACSSLSLHHSVWRQPTVHCMFFPLSTPQCVTSANWSLYVLPSLYTRVCDGSQLFIVCSSLSLHQSVWREPTVHCMFFPLSSPEWLPGANCSLHVLPSLYTRVCDGSQLFIACSSLSLHQNDCREPTIHCMFLPLSTPECVTWVNCSLHVLPSLFTRMIAGSQLVIVCSSLSLHQSVWREPTVHCMFFPLSSPEWLPGANWSLYVLSSLYTRVCDVSQLFIVCSSLSLHQSVWREPTGHCMFLPLSTPECVTGANCSRTCSATCGGDSSCDLKDGACSQGCVPGYTGRFCQWRKFQRSKYIMVPTDFPTHPFQQFLWSMFGATYLLFNPDGQVVSITSSLQVDKQAFSARGKKKQRRGLSLLFWNEVNTWEIHRLSKWVFVSKIRVSAVREQVNNTR